MNLSGKSQVVENKPRNGKHGEMDKEFKAAIINVFRCKENMNIVREQMVIQ